jgi:Domain of unknown function (DUF1843)
MPTRKTSKKPARKAAKGTKRKASYGKGSPIRPIYGIAIYDVLQTGSVAEKKKLVVQARKHLKDVQAALAALEKEIASN